MKLFKVQELELKGLMFRLSQFEKSGKGKIYNIGIMTNSDFPTDVFVQYELTYSNSASPVTESNLYRITKDGNLINFKEFFSNPFEKYAFLGRCLTENIENIEIIDNQ
jgi:AAA+ ATPase superfamily predicted ATPase